MTLYRVSWKRAPKSCMASIWIYKKHASLALILLLDYLYRFLETGWWRFFTERLFPVIYISPKGMYECTFLLWIHPCPILHALVDLKINYVSVFISEILVILLMILQLDINILAAIILEKKVNGNIFGKAVEVLNI